MASATYHWDANMRDRGYGSPSGEFRAASDKAAQRMALDRVGAKLLTSRHYNAAQRLEQARDAVAILTLRNQDTGRSYDWTRDDGWEASSARDSRLQAERETREKREATEKAQGYRSYHGILLPPGNALELHPLVEPDGRAPAGSGKAGYVHMDTVTGGTAIVSSGEHVARFWPARWDASAQRWVATGPGLQYKAGAITERFPLRSGGNIDVEALYRKKYAVERAAEGSNPMTIATTNPLSKAAQKRADQRARERKRLDAEYAERLAKRPPITQHEITELVNNYHLAKGALGGIPTPSERQKWAVDGFVREHPEFQGWEIALLGELQEALSAKPVNPNSPAATTKRDLRRSIDEEHEAQGVYRKRAKRAKGTNDGETEALWLDVAGEEDGHEARFRSRLKQLGGNPNGYDEGPRVPFGAEPLLAMGHQRLKVLDSPDVYAEPWEVEAVYLAAYHRAPGVPRSPRNLAQDVVEGVGRARFNELLAEVRMERNPGRGKVQSSRDALARQQTASDARKRYHTKLHADLVSPQKAAERVKIGGPNLRHVSPEELVRIWHDFVESGVYATQMGHANVRVYHHDEPVAYLAVQINQNSMPFVDAYADESVTTKNPEHTTGVTTKNPLVEGYSPESVSTNIEKLMAEHRDHDQAIAIALDTARKAYRREHPSGPLPHHLRDTRKRNPAVNPALNPNARPVPGAPGLETRVTENDQYVVRDLNTGRLIGGYRPSRAESEEWAREWYRSHGGKDMHKPAPQRFKYNQRVSVPGAAPGSPRTTARVVKDDGTWVEVSYGHGASGRFRREDVRTAPSSNPDGMGIDRNEAITRIKAALKRRSKRTWSVTGGRGTSWGWIDINVPPARRPMNDDDAHELARLLDLPLNMVRGGASVPAGTDFRQEYIDRAEGRKPTKEGVPYWDNPGPARRNPMPRAADANQLVQEMGFDKQTLLTNPGEDFEGQLRAAHFTSQGKLFGGAWKRGVTITGKRATWWFMPVQSGVPSVTLRQGGAASGKVLAWLDHTRSGWNLRVVTPDGGTKTLPGREDLNGAVATVERYLRFGTASGMEPEHTNPGRISRAARKRTATIVEHAKGPRGGETSYRFPMNNKAHARSAIQRLPQADDLTAAEKHEIAQRAANMLGEVTPGVRRWGVTRLTRSPKQARERKPTRVAANPSLTCPGCGAPIAGDPEPGTYTCSGCGAELQVN